MGGAKPPGSMRDTIEKPGAGVMVSKVVTIIVTKFGG
jgi:hypothetical protein